MGPKLPDTKDKHTPAGASCVVRRIRTWPPPDVLAPWTRTWAEGTGTDLEGAFAAPRAFFGLPEPISPLREVLSPGLREDADRR